MKRLRLAGLLLTLLAVVVLAVSLVRGLGGGGGVGPMGETAEEREQRIRVEVLNAAGTSGLARAVTDQLRDRGFDVVYYGNAGSGFARDTSLVLDRAGNAEAAQAVADALGISRIRAAPDTTLYLEVTVVVGRDWADPSRPPAADSAAAPASDSARP